MRIHIDPDTCNGHGQCTFAAPSILSMGDDGRPVYVPDVPEEFEAEAEDAASLCPLQAISLDID